MISILPRRCFSFIFIVSHIGGKNCDIDHTVRTVLIFHGLFMFCIFVLLEEGGCGVLDGTLCKQRPFRAIKVNSNDVG